MFFPSFLRFPPNSFLSQVIFLFGFFNDFMCFFYRISISITPSLFPIEHSWPNRIWLCLPYKGYEKNFPSPGHRREGGEVVYIGTPHTSPPISGRRRVNRSQLSKITKSCFSNPPPAHHPLPLPQTHLWSCRIKNLL